jgi:hypothetical protein
MSAVCFSIYRRVVVDSLGRFAMYYAESEDLYTIMILYSREYLRVSTRVVVILRGQLSDYVRE